jgi:tetrapyrrole methylase family protein/MazG family protein
LLDAIDADDAAAMVEELGDVLLQVLLHARIGEEEGRFSFADAVESCARKLIRRHPHVFADVEVADADAVLEQWHRIKSREKGGQKVSESVLAGVPRHLPALARAQKVQRRAARVGFDWPSIDGVLAKIEEELAEVKAALRQGDEEAAAEEIGDLLFAVVNLSRFRKEHAEELLHGTVAKFERRFRALEEELAAAGRNLADASLAELDAVWERIKREKRAADGK